MIGLFSRCAISVKEFGEFSKLITINGKSFVLSDWGEGEIAITSTNKIIIKESTEQLIKFELGDKIDR